jgi:hypothetical protein
MQPYWIKRQRDLDADFTCPFIPAQWSKSRRGAEVRFDVFHEQVQVELVNGRGLKAKFAIEGLRRLILGVSEHGTAAHDIGGLGRAQNGIFEQGGAQAFALFCAIHS